MLRAGDGTFKVSTFLSESSPQEPWDLCFSAGVSHVPDRCRQSPRPTGQHQKQPVGTGPRHCYIMWICLLSFWLYHKNPFLLSQSCVARLYTSGAACLKVRTALKREEAASACCSTHKREAQAKTATKQSYPGNGHCTINLCPLRNSFSVTMKEIASFAQNQHHYDKPLEKSCVHPITSLCNYAFVSCYYRSCLGKNCMCMFPRHDCCWTFFGPQDPK